MFICVHDSGPVRWSLFYRPAKTESFRAEMFIRAHSATDWTLSSGSLKCDFKEITINMCKEKGPTLHESGKIPITGYPRVHVGTYVSGFINI